MIKAILLVFDTARTWDTIAEDKRRVVSILFAYLLPLLLLTSVIEGYGLFKWGRKWTNQVLISKQYEIQEIVTFQIFQTIIALAVVFVGATLLKALGETFHGRHSYTQAFTVVAYGLGPMYLLHLFDAFPSISPWFTWGIGIVLTVMILYHGVPRVMLPDPPHAFGLFLTSALLLILTTGLARYLTYMWLQGKFKQVDTLVHDAVGRLHF
jgi:hypothetical protein